jgi:hypothetical protein
MKKKLVTVLVILTLTAAASFGQTTIKGMALNGVTGLIATPSAQIGWERTADIGVDVGYHWINDDGDSTHIPKASVSLFKKGEIAIAYDSMGLDEYPKDKKAILLNGKFQFYIEGTSAVAIGGNLQFIERNSEDYNAQQLYLVATYGGEFFNMPAATSLSFGKTFGDRELGVRSGNIDFAMGFELTLFPEILKNYVQWINDFSNYSYSMAPSGSDTQLRGSYNTGVRIDPLKNTQYKFVIDAVITDVFDDDDRSFCLGLTFGMGVK